MQVATRSALVLLLAMVGGALGGKRECEPALEHLVAHGVASSHLVHHVPTNGSEVCGGGPCCTPAMSAELLSRGRFLLQETLRRETTTLLGAIVGAKDKFADAMNETLSSSEVRTLATFRSLYPRIVGHMRKPLNDLFVDLKSSLNEPDEGTVERALNSFWDELFPIVYHSMIHMRLDPFSSTYMECLKLARRTINPWNVVPSLISDALARGLGTARLMSNALNVGVEVVLKTQNYQIPKECEVPTARLHFCAACHGSLAPPCSGLCLNVARGCLGPLTELDGAWADLGNAANRVEDALKNSGVAQLLRGLHDKFSDAIMVAMESGAKLQRLVRNECGPKVHEKNEAWLAKTNEGLNDKPDPAPTNSLDSANGGSQLEVLAADAAAVLSGSWNFWDGIADGACKHMDAQDTNCWNGVKVAEFSRPAASAGATAQKYNPEVQISRQDSTLNALVDKLRTVKRMVTRELTWMPEANSLKKNSDVFEGSGTDDYQIIDDEDSDDDGMGSGTGPVIEKGIDEKKISGTHAGTKMSSASINANLSRTLELFSVTLVIILWKIKCSL